MKLCKWSPRCCSHRWRELREAATDASLDILVGDYRCVTRPSNVCAPNEHHRSPLPPACLLALTGVRALKVQCPGLLQEQSTGFCRVQSTPRLKASTSVICRLEAARKVVRKQGQNCIILRWALGLCHCRSRYSIESIETSDVVEQACRASLRDQNSLSKRHQYGSHGAARDQARTGLARHRRSTGAAKGWRAGRGRAEGERAADAAGRRH